MFSPYYEAFTGGETDLHEIMQLCSDLSSDNSLSPHGCLPPDQQIQPTVLYDDFINAASVQFDNAMLAFDHAEQTSQQLFAQGSADSLDSAVQIHAQRSKEVQEFGIYLDISNVLAMTMRNHSSYPLLESRLRDELVALYVDHVHPLCPIIDEQNFWWHFITLREDEFSEMFPAIMFNAMLFAAFGVSHWHLYIY
jgi:hypothetical protein